MQMRPASTPGARDRPRNPPAPSRHTTERLERCTPLHASYADRVSPPTHQTKPTPTSGTRDPQHTIRAKKEVQVGDVREPLEASSRREWLEGFPQQAAAYPTNGADRSCARTCRPEPLTQTTTRHLEFNAILPDSLGSPSPASVNIDHVAACVLLPSDGKRPHLRSFRRCHLSPYHASHMPRMH